MWDYFDDIRIITIKQESQLKNLISNLNSVGIKNFKINKYPKTGKGKKYNKLLFIKKKFLIIMKCVVMICVEL